MSEQAKRELIDRAKALRAVFLMAGTHGEEVKVLAAALQEAERRGVEKGLGEIRKWASVAFYPGPDERGAFQEGYMAGIGEADRIARLLSEKEEDRE